jgi:hypothetical protein
MSARRTAFVIGLLCIIQMLSQLAEGASPEWEAAFPSTAAPERVYFRAHYLDGRGQTHELRVWRDGDRRLRRRTDDAIDLYVDRDKAGELDFRIVDHRRHVVIRADRTSFHRVGRFSGWIGLAHVLDVPHGTYVVTRLSDAPASPTARDECAWFRLATRVPLPRVSEICWSRRWGLPLAIETTSGTEERLTQFSIDEVRAFEPDHTTFAIDTSKFIEIDARPDDDLFD